MSSARSAARPPKPTCRTGPSKTSAPMSSTHWPHSGKRRGFSVPIGQSCRKPPVIPAGWKRSTRSPGTSPRSKRTNSGSKTRFDFTGWRTRSRPMQVHGMLSADQLLHEIGQGSIDTLIVASCDMQGRLIGKRISGWYFAEHARQHGIHFCTYLLGTDIELETPKGYELMTWESGYVDYLSRPDWATARRIPWLEGTALILADVVDESNGKEITVHHH